MPTDSLMLVKVHFEKSLGDIGAKIYQKSISKLNISENPSQNEIEKLISQAEAMIVPIYGNEKSRAVIDELRKKLIESGKSETHVSNDIAEEIDSFLAKNALPTDVDITDYARYLAKRFGGNVKNVETDLIEKVRIHVKSEISRKKIACEIGNFLVRYPEPTQKDVDDLITYVRLSKLAFKESELRDEIERQRLYRKFHGEQDVSEGSPLDNLINSAKTSNDRETISKLMQKQGLSYLIKDEKGISDRSLSEFIDLMMPNENDMKDALTGMGLEHLIKKK